MPVANPNVAAPLPGSISGYTPIDIPNMLGGAGGVQRYDPTGLLQQRQSGLLGPLADLLPQGAMLYRSDVPLLEYGLNTQNREMAIRDRQQGVSRLESARDSVGTSPESTLARELAVQRASGSGPLGDDKIAAQRSALKDQGALAGQSAQRELQAQMASRGLGGGLPAMQTAMLAQSLATQQAGNLAGYDLDAAQLQETAQRAALEDLRAVSGEEELRRLALEQLLADAYLNTQYGEWDLSGLLGQVPAGGAPVGLLY